MRKHILYAGDDTLKEAACYLSGIMTHYGIEFDHIASTQPFPTALLDHEYHAVIISDYPAKNFARTQLESLADRVRAGLGLLMIGGWASFSGAETEYPGTPLADVLPVAMQSGDDRVNCAQPCLVELRSPHPMVDGLPFDSVCPGVGGFNRLTTKSGATEVLAAARFRAARQKNGYSFTPQETAPLLVAGSYGAGRVTAFASDVAPHWVGGLVDWGDGRVHACAPGANPIEIGNWYAQLFFQILKWTARL
jgi:uncharacterized membrane protein